MDAETRKKFASIKGKVLVDSSELIVSGQGVSVLGAKSLLITDHPAAYFHDSGGLMIQENQQSLESTFQKRAAIHFKRLSETENQIEIRIFLELNKAQVAEARTNPKNEKRAAALPKLLWDFGRAVARTRDAELFIPVTLPFDWLVGTTTLDTGQQESDGVYLYAKDRTIRAHLCRAAASGATAVWSFETVTLRAEDEADLRIEGETSWRGRPVDKAVTGVRVAFPDREERDEFLAAAIALVTGTAKTGEEASREAQKAIQRLNIDKAQPNAGGILRCIIDVEGPRFGGTRRLEATLFDKRMECRLNGDSVMRIDYDNPALRVSATPEHLVMYERDLGAIGIRLGDVEDTWVAELLSKEGVIAAAKRAVQGGPYPVLSPQDSSAGDSSCKDFRAAVATVEERALSIVSTDGDRRIPIDHVKMLKPDFSRDVRLEIGFRKTDTPMRISASVPILEALQTEIRAKSLASAPVDRLPAYLKAATSLEEEYFLDVIFGPCLHLHAALLSEEWNARGIADLEGRIDFADLETDAAQVEADRLATLFAGGIAELQRHFDRVAQLLPAFVRHSDEQLLLGATPEWLKQQESELRRILGTTLARASMEVGALATQAGRISDIDPDRVKESFGTTALAIGAGVMINPIFLVGAAQQAFQQHSTTEQRRADLSGQALGILRQLADRWNSFVHELIPMLSYSLTEGLYPHRVMTAARLGSAMTNEKFDDDARQVGFRRVAQRLARLDVRRRYPAASLPLPGGRDGRGPLTRGELVDRLRSGRDMLATDYFSAL